MRFATRSEPQARIDDWLANLPPEGLRAMCSWERFGTFAREPERRKVGIDARITREGTVYEVDPDLAGEEVVLWWGIFDTELYVERGERRYGPYAPVGGPTPLHRYRRFKKTRTQQRAERIATLAEHLALPGSVWGEPLAAATPAGLPSSRFADPDPFQEIAFPSAVAAKRAIADFLGVPLAKLAADEMAKLDAALARSLRRADVIDYARTHLKPLFRG